MIYVMNKTSKEPNSWIYGGEGKTINKCTLTDYCVSSNKRANGGNKRVKLFYWSVIL